jgi:glycosyltransferase involved in cell wall biosynthesis
MDAGPHPRVVLVHDWLTGMRGGEKCLEVVCRHWPEAHLRTLLHCPGSVTDAIERLRPRASWLNLLPGVSRYYRYLLPLMPAVMSSLRLPECDLVVSLSHCVAKSACPPRAQDGTPVPHVCYCFTPMRYAWHLRRSYFDGRFRGLKSRLLDILLRRLRAWDRHSADRVSHFVAISRTVQARIKECYDRSSVVIHPPVDTDFYHPAPLPRQDNYLIVSAFAPYKRLDLAIEACNRLKRPLVIIGKGQDEARLRALAGPTIHFLGWQPDGFLRDQLRRCRALLFPGEEDFGIVPVEAMACGTPVIAFGRGGVTETVAPLGPALEPTGLFFPEQSADSLADAILRFEAQQQDFDPEAARRQALRFSTQLFAEQFFAYLDAVLRRDTATPARQAA